MPDNTTVVSHGVPAADDNGPPRIPDHELLRCIGKGSYGEVWLAKSAIGSFRAVKIVYRDNFTDSRPFDREFAGIQRYEPISRSHPGLVTILHVGINKDGGYFYYVMELADDHLRSENIDHQSYAPKTLHSELRHRGRLPLEECLQIGLSLTAALDYMHQQGLVHRDIKPPNIIFVNGAPKLADIGLVSDSASASTFVGTEGFIPREGPGSPQADIYALGKVLYEIATGKDRLEFPELPTDVAELPQREGMLQLNKVILRAAHNSAEHRYGSAAAMRDDLCRLQEGKRVRRSLPLRPKVLLATVIVVVVALSLLVASGFLDSFSERRALQRQRNALAQATRPAVKSSTQHRPDTANLWQRCSDFPLLGFQYDVVENGGYLYVVGGWNGDRLTSSYFAKVNQDGSVDPWKTTTALPQVDQGPGMTRYKGWIYAALEDGKIYRAAFQPDGSLGDWYVEDRAAPYHGGRLSARAFNGRLYILGGVHYTPLPEVYFASINDDGTLGQWGQTTSMPQPRQHQSVHFFRDRAYIVGGITTGNVILNSTLSSGVNPDGTLGAWREEADLPTPLWYQNSVQLEDKIIIFGGLSGYTSGPNDSVLCGSINPSDGSLSQWVMAGKMPSPYVSGPGAAYSPTSGMIYLIGGITGYRGEYSADVWRASPRTFF